MSTLSSIAIFFIIWWLCLFVVLPFGVRNAHEAGETVGEGHEAGAPVRTMLWRKAAITTVLSVVVFVMVYGIVARGWIGFEDIPLLGSAKP
ncbi:MAG: DUF1467 family protein [Rhizobiales bacterium]|nr:DUF1467 family protein [Hyphomicrobiales bacterium]MBI3674477.1 DUF1467 family protein [Hyphomicrobiales bacterium]